MPRALAARGGARKGPRRRGGSGAPRAAGGAGVVDLTASQESDGGAAAEGCCAQAPLPSKVPVREAAWLARAASGAPSAVVIVDLDNAAYVLKSSDWAHALADEGAMVAFFYRGCESPMQSEARRWEALKRSGALLVRGCPLAKDGADVVCAMTAQHLHLVLPAGAPIVLVSGDGAFDAMRQRLREQGRRAAVLKHPRLVPASFGMWEAALVRLVEAARREEG